MDNKFRIACFIGAGYSHIAGLPLGKDLLISDTSVLSVRSMQRFEMVRKDYNRWRDKNPEKHTEEYLSELFSQIISNPPFAYAVELLASTLASPRSKDNGPHNPRYAGRLTRPTYCDFHVRFWKAIFSFTNEVSVLTTNYDLLIERALRHRPMKRGFGVGFYYGGIKQPQILKGNAEPFSVTKPMRQIELIGKVPLIKLHGSLNWSHHNNRLQMYQDMRPAFRTENSAAIVPPIPQKTIPSWLTNVWIEAENELTQANIWLICGYSLPSYDHSVLELIQKSSAEVSAIFVLDPNSESIIKRLKALLHRESIFGFSGLPEGIDEFSEAIKELELN